MNGHQCCCIHVSAPFCGSSLASTWLHHQVTAAGVLVELDVGELRDTVGRQEHQELAGGEAQLADVDMDVADRGLGEAAAPRALLLGLGQAGNAVALQAAVERAAGQPRVCVIKQRAAQCRFPSRSSWLASSKRGE